MESGRARSGRAVPKNNGSFGYWLAQDGFCDETGTVNPHLPGSQRNVAFADEGDRTLVTTIVQYASADSLQVAIDMELEGGMASTLGRLDELLPQLEAS